MIHRRLPERCLRRLRTAVVIAILPLVASTFDATTAEPPAIEAKANPAQAAQGDWPQWRGPLANGIAPDADPPVHWSPDDNIAWKTALPGSGSSTPIVWGDRIFLTAAIKTDRRPDRPIVKHPEALTEPPNHYYQLVVLCLDRTNGDIRWQDVAAEVLPREGHHQTHTYAGGSPVTDGQRLIVSFGSYGLFCYNLEGQLQWQRDLGDLRTRRGWGEATTPALDGDSIVVPWDQEDDSFLFKLNAQTGDTEWQIGRPNEPTNWSTPVILEQDGRKQIILNGTHRARAYALDSGEPIWACGDLSVNAIPTPVFSDRLIFCMSGYRKNILYAIPRDARGDLSDSNQIVWSYDRNTPYVASPILYEGLLYLTRQRSTRLTILKAESGDVLREAEQIPGLTDIYASPIAAAGRLYYVDRAGTTAVLNHGPEAEVLAINRLNDTIDASPVALDNTLYLRSWTTLYCIRDR